MYPTKVPAHITTPQRHCSVWITAMSLQPVQPRCKL